MKKIILLPILIIGAAASAAPYLIGTTVEDSLRLELEEAAKDAAMSGFTIELVDYQRNYLDATATSRISFAMPNGNKQQSTSLDMQHKISHIPQILEQVIASVDTELLLSDETKAELDPLFKGQSPLLIKTRIFLDGHQDASIHSPDVKGQLSKDGKDIAIDWRGINGYLWQSAERDNITFNAHLPGMTMNPIKAQSNASDGAKDETLSLQELRYSGKMHRGNNGMWLGDVEGSVDSIAVDANNEGEAFSLLINNIGIKGNQNESNGLINGGGAFTANSINVNGFLLSNAVYDVAIENIDADTVLAWQETAGTMMQNKIDPAKGLEPLAKHIPALFNAHPALQIKNLSVDSPMGRFAFKLDASVKGKWEDKMLQNPVLLVPALKLDLDADLPKAIAVMLMKKQISDALIQQATLSGTEINAEQLDAHVNQVIEQQLGGLITQGYIKEDKAQLQSHITFNDSKLTVNGVDASQIIAAIMMQANSK